MRIQTNQRVSPFQTPIAWRFSGQTDPIHPSPVPLAQLPVVDMRAIQSGDLSAKQAFNSLGWR
jgi:hypothetical protein